MCIVAHARSAWPSLPPRPALKVTLRPLVVSVFLIETKAETMSKRVLATTYVNSFLITLRLLIKHGKSIDAANLNKAFAGIDDFDFRKYHSSQYGRMAEEIAEAHFGIQSEPSAPNA